MRFYVNLAKSWAILVFAVAIYARVLIPLVSLFLSLLLCLGFPKNFSLDRVCILQLFQLSSTVFILTWLRAYRGRLVSYNLIIKSQSFSGPVSLHCDLHNYFLASFSSLR